MCRGPEQQNCTPGLVAAPDGLAVLAVKASVDRTLAGLLMEVQVSMAKVSTAKVSMAKAAMAKVSMAKVSMAKAAMAAEATGN